MSARDRAPDEAFEPFEPKRRVPLPVLWIAVALAIWGAVTLIKDSAAHRRGVSTRAAEAKATLARGDAPGAALFAQRCSTCHQGDGGGVSEAVPPLAGSPVIAADPRAVTQVLLHGLAGPIRVEGADYDGHMPAFGSVLNDAQLARIATYVRQTWGQGAGAVDGAFVARERASTATRGAPLGGGEEVARLAPALGPQPPAPAAAPVLDQAEAMAIASHGVRGGWSCASCHGAVGEGRDSVPRLAGLPADYIVAQLGAFASGARSSDSMRAVARQLDGGQRLTLARYYATLASASAARPSLDGDVARGADLALNGDAALGLPACFSCHGPSGFGVAPNFPAIAAQQPAYAAGRVAAIGTSQGTPRANLMTPIARRLDDADRRAAADYLATLPPPPTGAVTNGGTR